MTRLKLEHSIADAVLAMADGNPGAINTLMDIMASTKSIDPQCALEGLGPLMQLDMLEIYGTEIYIIHDKCGKDVRKTLLLLRATQLGIIEGSKLKSMAEDQLRQVNLTTEEWANIEEDVCTQLTSFATAADWDTAKAIAAAAKEQILQDTAKEQE